MVLNTVCTVRLVVFDGEGALDTALAAAAHETLTVPIGRYIYIIRVYRVIRAIQGVIGGSSVQQAG